MMTTLRWTTIAIAACGVFAGAVLAADQPYNAPQPSRTDQQRYGADARQGQNPNPQATQDQRLGHLRQTSRLVGMAIHNEQGESIGQLKDVVLDTGRQEVAYGVLSFGGFMGMGDKLFAIPWDAFRTEPGAEYLTLPVSKERLQQAQGFDKNQWPNMADPSWIQQTRQTLGLPSRSPGQQAQSGSTGEQPMARIGAVQTARASEIMGRDVNSPTGEDLGHISDILIDMHSGHLAYGVLAHGGTLGFGQKLAVVPWSAIQWAAPDQALALSASKDLLNQISFQGDTWPNLADQSYATQLYQRFNQQPYWQVYGYAFYGQPDPSEMAGQHASLQGQITSVQTTKYQDADYLKLTIQSDSGARSALVGPKSVLDHHNVELRPDQSVQLWGSTQDVQGQQVFVAQRIRIHGQDQTIKLSESYGEMTGKSSYEMPYGHQRQEQTHEQE